MALFAAKLGEDRENLLAVHERAFALRKLSWDSLELGIRGGLLSVDYSDATARANSLLGANAKPVLPERLKSMPMRADKLGHWFARIGINQIVSVLRVEF